ncbi:hypothetical protein WDW86_12745 [Bdellovibrionota bacterium FG-2]
MNSVLRLSFIVALPALVAILGHEVLADTALPIVGHYDQAGAGALWKKASGVPAGLITKVSIANPSRAFMAPYRDVFFQNDRMVVCAKTCDSPQQLIPSGKNGEFSVSLPLFEKTGVLKDDQEILAVKQATIYTYINGLFDRMEQLGFSPSQRLVVMVDRDVNDPSLGLKSTNNAFFNNRDWTLSFLPAENTFWMWLTNSKLLDSAYDPVVAMHEATHSVFQAIVGEALNPEIMGLHEAFADYFAMAQVSTPQIGTIMFRGKAIRSAETLIPYKSGMEAHDLGNVVASGLWKVRTYLTAVGLVDLADQAALESVKLVGNNPYASAGDVITAYMSAFRKLGAKPLSLLPSLAVDVAAIWAETGLVASDKTPDISVLQGSVDSSKYAISSFVLKMPQQVSDDYSIDPLMHLRLGLIETREPRVADGTHWFLVSLTDGNAAEGEIVTPIWILYSDSLKSILVAYSIGLQPILTSESPLYTKLKTVGAGLGDLLAWTKDFGQGNVDFYNKKTTGVEKWMYKPGKDEVTDTYFTINGQTVPGKVHAVTYKRRVLAFILAPFVGKAGRAGLKARKILRLFTVPKAELPGTSLPELSSGEILVGYELELRSGVKTTVLLEEAGQNELTSAPQVAN